MSNFMKIRPVGDELFHTEGQTDKHNETYLSISAVLRTPPFPQKIWHFVTTHYNLWFYIF